MGCRHTSCAALCKSVGYTEANSDSEMVIIDCLQGHCVAAISTRTELADTIKNGKFAFLLKKRKNSSLKNGHFSSISRTCFFAPNLVFHAKFAKNYPKLGDFRAKTCKIDKNVT